MISGGLVRLDEGRITLAKAIYYSYVGSGFAIGSGRASDTGRECGVVFRYLQILLGRTRHPAADRRRTPSSKGSRTPNPGEADRAGPQKSGDSAEPGFLGQSKKAVE